ncbi:hypothetical protein EIL87_11685 [Saccharopolyspora rhizosphaerae]|uniref:PNPLA domain-containing protein n=1 Tax=Saccharopolyspora rhizosphaerae TaxID=2492662 RepID=A0A3R8P5H2_9PSEU|nr:patatin-like phospholipase family protein [Saccharopolyspora rhizosphaerae]RRO16938.1 hypothetical protein EIL87_11685 [Saccharopolyspora rhizosphaerae]
MRGGTASACRAKLLVARARVGLERLSAVMSDRGFPSSVELIADLPRAHLRATGSTSSGRWSVHARRPSRRRARRHRRPGARRVVRASAPGWTPRSKPKPRRRWRTEVPRLQLRLPRRSRGNSPVGRDAPHETRCGGSRHGREVPHRPYGGAMSTHGDARTTSTNDRSGVGLVLGAGGVLGACWSIGALRALEMVGRWDPRTCDTIVGTSSGAVLATLLSRGISVQALDAGQRSPDEGVLAEHGFNCANPMMLRTPLGLLGLGSPRLLAQCLANPLGAPLLHWCVALAPSGRGSLVELREFIDQVVDRNPVTVPMNVVATDYDSGQREIFHPGSHEDLVFSEAVAASCSVPGLFPPVSIAGRRYVDGAIGSSTNADILLETGVDTAIVVAPMAANSFDRPRSPLAQAERLVRRRVTEGLRAEVDRLRENGIHTTVLAPTAEDLGTLGVNAFDCTRRLPVMDTALRTTSRQLEEDGTPSPHVAVGTT